MEHDPTVIVIGAGLAGLSCACHLTSAGRSVLVLDASDGPGGRVRTDIVEGYRIDRGFQVLLTAYPEARRMLDYEALDLKPFVSGTLVRADGAFNRLADPWRNPLKAFQTAFSPIGSFGDKLRVGKLRSASREKSIEEIFAASESTTLESLRSYGFGDEMIDRFFRPFLGGVFLERDLNTTSRMLHFVFSMFSQGETAVPAKGMGEVPKQLADRLPDGSVRYNSPVESLGEKGVVLEGGEELHAAQIVVATDATMAVRLLGDQVQDPKWNSVTCLSFSAESAPVNEPILVLNGEGQGPVNNLCVPSLVSADYAPEGRHLISASVIGDPEESDEQLDSAVRSQLQEWYGTTVKDWTLLRVDRIRHALPDRSAGALNGPSAGEVRPGVFVCGDHTGQGSIQSALVSGRRVAEAICR